MTYCKACNTEIPSNYCPNCGQPAQLKRIDAHYITHEIVHVLHFEKGILYTIKELLLRPGSNIRRFISEERGRLVKPVIFIIIASLIYTVLSHYFHSEPDPPRQRPMGSAVSYIMKWTDTYLGYANIIMGTFIAFWVGLFFRKYQYNYFETMILICFVMGAGMFICVPFTLAGGLLHINLNTIGSGIAIVYCAWAIAQFFDGSKAVSYIKALVAYVLGVLTYSALAFGIGGLVDLLVRH